MNRSIRLAFAAVCVLGLGVGSPGDAGERLTYLDLIGRLTDLERLAVLPPAGEKCAQWSSYDRRSRYDEKTGKYLHWSANGDRGGFIRMEGGKKVLAEMEGPGIIWLIHSARALSGHVRIFLDGAKEPAVDLPFIGYFNSPGFLEKHGLGSSSSDQRKDRPFTRKGLCYTASMGHNCYLPIPFQKSCKIVADGKWGYYYQITYTTYPKGTVLPTFKRELSPEEAAALDKVNAFLEKCGNDPAGKRPGETLEKTSVTIEPGQTARVVELSGPRAVTALRIRLDLPKPPDDRAALRELCLRITWDGEAEPAVWSPLGDFFGTTPGVNHYSSLPLGITEDGFYSFWYMPFARSALIEIVNDGKDKRTVEVEVTHAPLTRPIDTLGRFHAKWHRDAFLPANPQRRAIDWTMLKTTGRGRYVGVMLHVWNPHGHWWGEGDEKFFIDGEKFPSTFGIGTEDYFGYSWCSALLFFKAYHNQTYTRKSCRNLHVGGGRGCGHISINRWHIGDNVPFQTSFEGTIEKYFRNSRPTLYAAVAYWYLAPGGTDAYKPVPVAERLVRYYCKEPPPPPRVKGVLEGEELRVLECTGGFSRLHLRIPYRSGWSGGKELWWSNAKPGNKLTLALPVKATGAYRILLRLTKESRSSIIQFYLNGKKLGGRIDLYSPRVELTGVLNMGIHHLAEGQHRLAIEIVGANEKANIKHSRAYMAGLDYVKLEGIK